jgi:hypothetical protein
MVSDNGNPGKGAEPERKKSITPPAKYQSICVAPDRFGSAMIIPDLADHVLVILN